MKSPALQRLVEFAREDLKLRTLEALSGSASELRRAFTRFAGVGRHLHDLDVEAPVSRRGRRSIRSSPND